MVYTLGENGRKYYYSEYGMQFRFRPYINSAQVVTKKYLEDTLEYKLEKDGK